MDDLIKRSDAVKAVLNMTMFEYRVPYDAVILTLQNLPSADRPQGEWRLVTPKTYDFEGYRCSECNNLSYGRTRFCSECGARMKGADDD